MNLKHQPDYPTTNCYVVKLHRNCNAESGQCRGRIEHVTSGVSFEFSSADDLSVRLLTHQSSLKFAEIDL
jgi:hypothetical protein